MITKDDINSIRHLLLLRTGELDGIDFEEHIQLPQVRSSMRIWKEDDRVVAFAYVDGYCNLWFDVENPAWIASLGREIISWGCQVIHQRNLEANAKDALDCSCRADQSWRVELLMQNGFIQQPMRSIKYSLSLSSTLPAYPFPSGFSFRNVNDLDRVEDLVALHRAAFGTDHMTIEERRSMMLSPQYVCDLDLLALSPDNRLAAFCLASITDENRKIGYTDPIGTHPDFRRLGLARALVSAALQLLFARGAERVEFGTSSENAAMNGLALALGFHPVSEKLWFSKIVTG